MGWGRGAAQRPAPTAAFRVTERRLRIIDFVVQQRKIRGEASIHHRLSGEATTNCVCVVCVCAVGAVKCCSSPIMGFICLSSLIRRAVVNTTVLFFIFAITVSNLFFPQTFIKYLQF